MNSPLFCYPMEPTSPVPLSMSTNLHPITTCNSLIERIRLFSIYIEESDERDLYDFYVDIINEIFGKGPAKGWELDTLRTKTFDEQKYIRREPDSVYHFLCWNGYIFKLCYKLLSNSLTKFVLPFSDIPNGLRHKIEKSYGRSYYGLRLFYHGDTNIPIGLNMNAFEYYMFRFALYGLKLTSDEISNFNYETNDLSVYQLLCLDYLKHFLPLDKAASMILPQLQYHVLSSIRNQKPSTSLSLNFIKKDVACKEFSSDKIDSSCWMLTSETTWRSELVAFFFADIWLNTNISIVPSTELTQLIRSFIKHLHLYSNCADHLPTDNLKTVLLSRHSLKIYQYLTYYMDNWPQDFSFRFLLENWICYIQPWRYENLSHEQFTTTETEVNDKWRLFIIRNLLCYTKLFHLAIKRFLCIDICSPRYSVMIFRLLKVFSHPYLLKMILDIEHMYVNNHSQHKKWNVILSDCLAEAEGPSVTYELMFSEERTYDYKLFCLKLQKTLDHVAVELCQFKEEQISRSKSSMLEIMISPRKYKRSDYTMSEWENIQTNLKSSLIYMEKMMNINIMTTPNKANLSVWSVSSISSNNSTTSIFNKSQSFIRSFENRTINLSRVIHTKEWEIDPDYVGTSSNEINSLVKLNMFLRKAIETRWKSYIFKYSKDNTILAGLARQIVLRAPMKIYSYEPRNDGSGKHVRTPKIVPPTVSFRWMASYYTLTWTLLFLTLVLIFNKTGLWIALFFFLRIIYLCMKYLLGYAPPFVWDDIHEN